MNRAPGVHLVSPENSQLGTYRQHSIYRRYGGLDSLAIIAKSQDGVMPLTLDVERGIRTFTPEEYLLCCKDIALSPSLAEGMYCLLARFVFQLTLYSMRLWSTQSGDPCERHTACPETYKEVSRHNKRT